MLALRSDFEAFKKANPEFAEKLKNALSPLPATTDTPSKQDPLLSAPITPVPVENRTEETVVDGSEFPKELEFSGAVQPKKVRSGLKSAPKASKSVKK